MHGVEVSLALSPAKGVPLRAQTAIIASLEVDATEHIASTVLFYLRSGARGHIWFAIVSITLSESCQGY